MTEEINLPKEGSARRFLTLGFPRSGTTLLSRLLDAHPAISSPPETHMFSAAGRFLAEQTHVEGPPIGVLSGLTFSGIPAAEVMAPLRDMLFAFHARIAGPKPVWVEKTGTDIFHLEDLESLVAGNMRFICLIRHPLDVIASNLDLATAMGAQLPELYALTHGVNGPAEGFARAWVDRTVALDAFCARHMEDSHALRYEDLLSDPDRTLARLLGFMGLDGDPTEMISNAFSGKARIGLGDFRIDGTGGLTPPVKDGWRRRLPRATAARILPVLEPLMERHGYPVPKLPRVPGREDAVRQFIMAAQMKRSAETGD